MNPTSLAKSIVEKAEAFSPFGKFERITAGICMAIPFFLMIVDPAPQKRNLWQLLVPIIIVIMPQLIRVKNNQRESKNDGAKILGFGSLLLFSLYWLFTSYFEIESKPSISAYVFMKGSHIFGMLLSVAAMLFLASGVVFWNRRGLDSSEWNWRSLLNLALGFLLICVVIFPLTLKPVHDIVAIFFFAGCAAGTLIRPAKTGKKPQHRFVDYTPLLIMAFAMFSHFAVENEWLAFCRWPFNLFNLFGAESIALWITGLDFILISLKRELGDEAALEKEFAEQKLVKKAAIYAK